MTRNEAIKKIKSVNEHCCASDWLDILEALGLIKFDEEVKDSPSMIIKTMLKEHTLPGTSNMLFADGIVNALYAAGYQIVRK